MSLVPCPECGHQVSTAAAVCPSCGAPQRRKAPTKDEYLNTTITGEPVPPGGAGTRIAILLGIGIPAIVVTAALVLPKTAPHSEPVPTDFSRPLFTRTATPVCPIAILEDNREGYGIKAVNHALGDVYGMADDLRKLGCEQWQSGVPLFVPPKYAQQGAQVRWLPAFQSPDFTGQPLLVPTVYLTN